jgi:20S proteasome alpha/beta subunit
MIYDDFELDLDECVEMAEEAMNAAIEDMGDDFIETEEFINYG